MSERIFIFPEEQPDGSLKEVQVPESKITMEHISFFVGYFSRAFDEQLPEVAKHAVFKNICSIMVDVNTKKEKRAEDIKIQANEQLQKIMFNAMVGTKKNDA